jgi:hypothetical protein
MVFLWFSYGLPGRVNVDKNPRHPGIRAKLNMGITSILPMFFAKVDAVDGDGPMDMGMIWDFICDLCGIYPLVNVYITMEKHHV